jgi:ketosteroid isomerase-like protein
VTVRHTSEFFRALEAQDMHKLRSLLAPDVTWSVPMAANGDNDNGAHVFTGVDAVMANFEQIGTLLRTVSFIGQRTTVDGSGRTSITEARGDFVTASGAPYRNVYVFHLDWRGGKVVAGIEYANPVTICQAFPLPDCS